MKSLISPLQQSIDLGGNVFVDSSAPQMAVNAHPGMHIVGTCSACSGPMLIPEFWAGTPEVYPKPTCADCGKAKKNIAKWGPVIEVE